MTAGILGPLSLRSHFGFFSGKVPVLRQQSTGSTVVTLFCSLIVFKDERFWGANLSELPRKLSCFVTEMCRNAAPAFSCLIWVQWAAPSHTSTCTKSPLCSHKAELTGLESWDYFGFLFFEKPTGSTAFVENSCDPHTTSKWQSAVCHWPWTMQREENPQSWFHPGHNPFPKGCRQHQFPALLQAGLAEQAGMNSIKNIPATQCSLKVLQLWMTERKINLKILIFLEVKQNFKKTSYWSTNLEIFFPAAEKFKCII